MEGGEPPGGRPANHFICQPIDTNNEVSANPEKKQSMQPSMDRLLPLEPAASRGPTTAAAATAAPVPGPGPRHGRCPRPLSPAAATAGAATAVAGAGGFLAGAARSISPDLHVSSLRYSIAMGSFTVMVIRSLNNRG